MNTYADKVRFLQSYGWHVGERDPRLNTKFPGMFMVCEPFDESEVPTEDGSSGPWCLVGDNLEALVDEAYDFLSSSPAKLKNAIDFLLRRFGGFLG